MMKLKLLVPLALTLVALFSGTQVFGSTGCDANLMQALQDSERLVASLRPDKPGQARVVAGDGSEFTAGQADWMKSQLSHTSQLCARGDQQEAVRVLGGVQALIRSHRKAVS